MALRMFPIMDGPAVPWVVMALYEKQAIKNHSQDLEELARRGGLSMVEAFCVLSGREWNASAYKLAESCKRDKLAFQMHFENLVRDKSYYAAAVVGTHDRDVAVEFERVRFYKLLTNIENIVAKANAESVEDVKRAFEKITLLIHAEGSPK